MKEGNQCSSMWTSMASSHLKRCRSRANMLPMHSNCSAYEAISGQSTNKNSSRLQLHSVPRPVAHCAQPMPCRSDAQPVSPLTLLACYRPDPNFRPVTVHSCHLLQDLVDEANQAGAFARVFPSGGVRGCAPHCHFFMMVRVSRPLLVDGERSIDVHPNHSPVQPSLPPVSSRRTGTRPTTAYTIFTWRILEWRNTAIGQGRPGRGMLGKKI